MIFTDFIKELDDAGWVGVGDFQMKNIEYLHRKLFPVVAELEDDLVKLTEEVTSEFEAGRTYVFKSEWDKDEYLESYPSNREYYNMFYKDGFYIDTINLMGSACAQNEYSERKALITRPESKYFKQKEGGI